MELFRLFRLKRKLAISAPIATFFKLHTCAEHGQNSIVTELEKGKSGDKRTIPARPAGGF